MKLKRSKGLVYIFDLYLSPSLMDSRDSWEI